jgi:hypothetical protein
LSKPARKIHWVLAARKEEKEMNRKNNAKHEIRFSARTNSFFVNFVLFVGWLVLANVRIAFALNCLNNPAEDTCVCVWWENTIVDGDVRGLSMIRTVEGDFVVGGTIFTQANDSDYYAARFNSQGDLIWQNTYGNTSVELGRSVAEADDGSGFVIAGYNQVAFSTTHRDVYLVKLDPTGSFVWDKVFNELGTQEPYSIAATSDGGFVVAGISDYDVFVMKVDSNANLIWRKQFGGSSVDRAYVVRETRDGGLILAGETASVIEGVPANGGNDVYIIKLDQDGNLEWQKTFGGSLSDKAREIKETADSGFVVVGMSVSVIPGGSPSGQADIYVLKLDHSGILEWEKMFGGGGNETGYSVALASDSGFVVAGGSSSQDIPALTNQGSEDAYLLKLNETGELEWQVMFGGIFYDSAKSVLAEGDTGFVVLVDQFNKKSGEIYFTGDLQIVKLEEISLPRLLSVVKGLGQTSNEFISPKADYAEVNSFEFEASEPIEVLDESAVSSNPDGSSPRVKYVKDLGSNKYRVNMYPNLPVGHWTKVTLNVRSIATTAEAAFTMWIGRLPGDINQDGVFNFSDLGRFTNEWNGLRRPELLDIDGNGVVNRADAIAIQKQWYGIPPARQAWSGKSLPPKL